MTRMLNAVVDRMVGVVAPKVTARAASVCRENTCYCRGINLYKRTVCLYDDGSVWYGPCKNVGPGC
ncbi:hypothetical protein I0C86_30265 [Plantactinospora sp. S1510]|uniref:Uncharacterized protein n=1 Tax=Plantactinospora alkalitolerans TaxID=2789879 RepID=A0ABS0H426_9ACTN|nr:hypothetical protein [Plantactinospora alkalitolerans]MBF9133215.1 hypothetical protein [Plantactinospora alkalitolerans]